MGSGWRAKSLWSLHAAPAPAPALLPLGSGSCRHLLRHPLMLCRAGREPGAAVLPFPLHQPPVGSHLYPSCSSPSRALLKERLQISPQEGIYKRKW